MLEREVRGTVGVKDNFILTVVHPNTSGQFVTQACCFGATYLRYEKAMFLLSVKFVFLSVIHRTYFTIIINGMAVRRTWNCPVCARLCV